MTIRKYIEMKQGLGRQFAEERRVLEKLNEFMLAIATEFVKNNETNLNLHLV
jgi:glutamate dehydrogenase/leucine dehydrogenase